MPLIIGVLMKLIHLKHKIEEGVNDYLFTPSKDLDEVSIINKIKLVCKNNKIFYKSRIYGPWNKYHLRSIKIQYLDSSFREFKIVVEIFEKTIIHSITVFL